MEAFKNICVNLWRLLKKSFRRYKMIYIAAAVVLVLLIGCLVSCHKHTPGPEATCTEPQICTECGKVLAEPLGHTPGPEATCSGPQLCTVCGEVITPALEHTLTAETCTEDSHCTVCGYIAKSASGHDVGEDGVCKVCGEQICAAGCEYIKPGADGTSPADAADLLSETANSGHYNNSIDAYYASYTLICGDYGLEYVPANQDGSENFAKILSDFAEKYPNQKVFSMIVPKAAAFLSPSNYDDLHDPISGYINNTYAKMTDKVNTVDAFGALEAHKGEYLYYRSDINWTSLGAYYATAEFLRQNGMAPMELNSYETVIQTEYTGALYYFANEDANLKINQDYTVLRYPHTGYTFQFSSDGENWENGKAIDCTAFGYSYAFIKGDQPLSVIRTDNHNGKTLMVIKDSFANAMIPYLIDYYETIVIVDFRQGMKKTEELVNRYDVNDILLICNNQSASDYQDTLKSVLMS